MSDPISTARNLGANELAYPSVPQAIGALKDAVDAIVAEELTDLLVYGLNEESRSIDKTLVASDAATQVMTFTASSKKVVMPAGNAAGMVIGRPWTISNPTAASNDFEIEDGGGGTLVAALAPGERAVLRLKDDGSAAGQWDVHIDVQVRFASVDWTPTFGDTGGEFAYSAREGKSLAIYLPDGTVFVFWRASFTLSGAGSTDDSRALQIGAFPFTITWSPGGWLNFDNNMQTQSSATWGSGQQMAMGLYGTGSGLYVLLSPTSPSHASLGSVPKRSEIIQTYNATLFAGGFYMGTV